MPAWMDPQLGQVPKAADPSSQGRMGSSVFYWYNYLANVFVPSIGLEAIIAPIEAFTTFTQ